MTGKRDAKRFDIVVAGGGLVGGSLAIALAEAGFSVALVEAVPPSAPDHPALDDRTIALSRSSCRILDGLGIWAGLRDSVWPVRQIHVSETGRFGTALIDAAEQGVGELGHVVQSRALGAALWARIGEYSNIDVRCPARVESLVDDADGACRGVRLDEGSGGARLEGRLLAVADGARSATRAMLGVDASVRDYAQTAIVCNLQVDERYCGYRAFERFHPDGPLALLPGAEGRYTLVLARSAGQAGALLDLSDTEFLRVVQALFGHRVGRLRQVGRRHAYPLSLVRAERVTAERAVLVGNAAHGLHPVAGQGFNLGLRDVACLAELLADAQRSSPDDFDPGRPALLAGYADWRATDQRNVVAFTDGLIRLFAVDGAIAGRARGLGLGLFDLSPALKRAFARHTMGVAGRQSRLARGLGL